MSLTRIGKHSSRAKMWLLVLSAAVWLGVTLGQDGAAQTSATPPKPQAEASRCVAAIPFEMVGSLAFFEVKVNGSRPLSFLLDSGANACIIETERAKELNIPLGKQVQGKGAGQGTYDVWMIDKDKISFALRGLVLRADLVASFDLSNNLAVLGQPVDGIIGYDLMEQYVTEIDYDAQVLRLFEPKTYSYRGTGESFPLIFKNRVPHVVASIQVPGQPEENRTLLVDSGSQDGVDDSLIARSEQVREVLSGVGNGKEFRGVHGRVGCFKLGKNTLKNFTGGGSGVALIGGEVLRRFTVVFDFSHQRMYLEPNQHFAEPVAEDRSGLVLRWAPKQSGMLVHDVAKDSPAAQAGLQREDLVTAIDGCPATAFRLDRVQRLLRQDHKSLTFTVRREGREVSVFLTTQSLFATNTR